MTTMNMICTYNQWNTRKETEMKIFVKRKMWMQSTIEEEPDFFKDCAVISINEPYTCSPLTKQDCKYSLFLHFYDITNEAEGYRAGITRPIMFDKEDAKKVIDFLDEIKKADVKELYIHCHAGFSRSAAVGTFANNYYHWGDDMHAWQAFYRENDTMRPNHWVLEKLVEEYEWRQMQCL